MKVKSMAFVAILGWILVLGACGKSEQTPAPTAANPTSTAAAQTAAPAVAETRLRTISDMANVWNALYKQNEKVINEYEGMPIMGLVTPPLAFASAVQFDIMNPNRQDGRFENRMMMAGYQGNLQQAGNQLTFTYDDKLQKDGFGPAHKAGDRVFGSGSLALDSGYFIWETFSERAGKKLERHYTEFKRLGDGSMVCLALSGQLFGMRGDAENRSGAIYLHNGPGRYDFVIAKGQAGPEFQALSFAEKGDLTKEQAMELFKAAGYEIEKSGGILAGKLVLDNQ